jgi:hypothetical protein
MMIETSEFPLATGLALDTFVAMDDVAVNDYHLPIELMMENAGLCLARLTALQMPRPAKVVIGMVLATMAVVGWLPHVDWPHGVIASALTSLCR